MTTESLQSSIIILLTFLLLKLNYIYNITLKLFVFIIMSVCRAQFFLLKGEMKVITPHGNDHDQVCETLYKTLPPLFPKPFSQNLDLKPQLPKTVATFTPRT